MPSYPDITCLRLLLVLCTGLLCCAAYVPCKKTNFASNWDKRLSNLAGGTAYGDDIACCASSWEVDKKNGTLRVYFKPLRDPAKKVKELRLYKHGTSDPYTKVRLLPGDYETVDADKHFLNTSMCSVKAASEYGYHTFEHISSGNYSIYGCWSDSAVGIVVTDFDESTLNCLSEIGCELDPPQNGMSKANMAYQNQLEQYVDVLYTLMNSNNAAITSWKVWARKNENDSLTCERENDLFEVMYNPVPDNKKHIQTFKIYNLTHGIYYVQVELLGHLSRPRTKIGEICYRFNRCKINATASQSSSEPETVSRTDENHLVKYLIGLAAVVIVCSFSYVVYRIRYYLRSQENQPGPWDPPRKDLARTKVLLLYARDCSQFNDLMVSFRDLLKNNNFEVYDCYDPAHSRTVDYRGPTLWMRCLVEDSSVRVVVVSTKCAQLQQLALMSGGSITYKQPEYLDGNFLYGLKDVMDVHTNIYQKIYSTVWEGFTQNEDILAILSDSRIYSLPTHLLELLRDLRHNTETPEETAELRCQTLILQKKLSILVRYANAEKDYLRSEILDMTSA